MFAAYRCLENRSDTDKSFQIQNLSRIQRLFCGSVSKPKQHDSQQLKYLPMKLTELNHLSNIFMRGEDTTRRLTSWSSIGGASSKFP